MKLWIRNMWKHGFYEVNGVVAKQSGDKWEITDCRYVLPLGEYATRERCLEIIDEIQNIMCRSGMILFKDIDITALSAKDIEPFKAIEWHSSLISNEKSEVSIHNAEIVVYEMPEE